VLVYIASSVPATSILSHISGFTQCTIMFPGDVAIRCQRLFVQIGLALSLNELRTLILLGTHRKRDCAMTALPLSGGISVFHVFCLVFELISPCVPFLSDMPSRLSETHVRLGCHSRAVSMYLMMCCFFDLFSKGDWYLSSCFP
jgi:hypothetical protein